MYVSVSSHGKEGDRLEKKYKITNIGTNEYLNYFFTTQTEQRIEVVIAEPDTAKVYFHEFKHGSDISAPCLKGNAQFTGSSLELTVKLDSPFTATIVSNDIMDEKGNLIGHDFCCMGHVGKKEDVESMAGTEEYQDFFVKVFSLRVKEDAFVEEEKFIASIFNKYLTYKKKYLLNYVKDKDIGTLYEECENECGMKKLSYLAWYQKKLKLIKKEEDDYRLTFTILMVYDQHYSNTDQNLQYRLYNNCMLMVYGKKIWSDKNITFASCPFQNIRAVLLNKTELENYNQLIEITKPIGILDEDEIKITAAHGSEKSKLNMSVKETLNFQNLGIYVEQEDDKAGTKQKEIIEKNITAAEQNQSKILIFPELSLNETVVKEMEKQLEKLSPQYLKIVVAGSYYKNDDGTYRNTAPIYMRNAGKWQRVADYHKMIPFSMGYTQGVADAYGISTKIYPTDEYRLLVEDIQLDKNITILPMGDCVIGVAICRDVMDMLEPNNPMHKYCDFVDMMLVISDNSGDSNMFVGAAECLARWHNCATLYTNSVNEAKLDSETECTTDSFLEISFAIYPFKKKDSHSSTSVSGEIAYLELPHMTITENKEKTAEPLRILNSKGIKYVQLNNDELAQCSKHYVFRYNE